MYRFECFDSLIVLMKTAITVIYRFDCFDSFDSFDENHYHSYLLL